MKKKKRNVYFLLILIILFSFGIGYSYLNTSLFINVTSIVNANVWDVSLDNLNVTTGSVAAIKEAIIDTNDSTSFEFEVKLEDEDDFYEFTIDVVNKGNVDAKLGSLVEVSSLTAEQENYFDHTIMYENKEPIEVNQIIKKEEFVRLKSRVEFKDDVVASSVPESAKTINVDLSLNYDLDDGNGKVIENNGKLIKLVSGNYVTLGSELCVQTECFYVISNTEDSVTLLSKKNITLDANPLQSDSAGTTIFSNGEVKYSGSLVEGYVNNYRRVLQNFGLKIGEARAITVEELENEDTFACVYSSGCSENYPWINSINYWTSSLVEGFSYGAVYYVDSYYGIYSTAESFDFLDFSLGVRPVITVPMSAISDLSLMTIDNKSYYFENGMIWNDWINSNFNNKTLWLYNGIVSKYGSAMYFVIDDFNNGNCILSKPTDLIKKNWIYDTKKTCN